MSRLGCVTTTTPADGDLFYAWALLRAARRFGDASLLEQAREVAGAIAAILIVEDPRGGGRPILLPGAERFRTETGVIFNPSYIMPLALHELAAVFALQRLAVCVEDCASLMWDAAKAGPLYSRQLTTL